jgi:hypothetical protein
VNTGRFTPERARQVALEREARRREQRLAEEAGAATAGERRVSVPIHAAGIVKKLDADALKGDTRSAAELRRWLADYPPEDDTPDLTALTNEELAACIEVARERLAGG